MPSTDSFLLNSTAYSQFADLTTYNQVRILVNRQGGSGSTNAKLVAKYRTSYSTTVGDFSDIGTSEVSANINSNNTYTASNWINLANAAKTNVFLAIIGSGASGNPSPTLGSIVLEFR
jgi:hypothetical protein